MQVKRWSRRLLTTFEVSCWLQVTAILHKRQRFLSGLDVLVYAAGQEGYATIADLKMEEAEKIMRFNYFVPLEMTKMALPHLRKTKGNVVFITSCICRPTKNRCQSFFYKSKYFC